MTDVLTHSPTKPAPRAAPIAHERVLVVFSGLVLAMLLAALDSTIVATALPTIVGELGGLAHLSWVVTAYLLAQTVVTPLYGKLGDLYGRKGVLQAAIVIFLVGSALCGAARNMTQLILFRALQGFGGGGLTVTTQAVIGDIVPPRERGRYQGIFGAVFGVASIAGPLLGGYFTTHITWRWIFYINLPLGILALVVLAATLPGRAERVRHRIDYAGAGLLAVALSATILVCDLGGGAYAWSSPTMLGLIAAAIVALLAFLFVEQRAAEPVLPLRLFRNTAFAVTSAVGLIVGFALFGSVTYLPLFLQIVKGATPTSSGLEMIAMMGGMLVTSIGSGQLISRTGRYKAFPIVGNLVMALGLLLLSRMTPATSMLGAEGNMLVLGLGLGLVMQVLVIAVQSAVDYADLGVATSGATLFRLVGGSLGTAVLGAIFASRLEARLSTLPAGGPAAAAARTLDPAALARLPESVRALFASAFTTSLSTIFVVAAMIAAVGFAIAWLLPEHPLREGVAATSADVGREIGETFPMPNDGDPATLLLRALWMVASHDVKRQFIEQVVARAGLDLSPLAAWLLVRVHDDPRADLASLCHRYHVAEDRLHAAMRDLQSRGFILEHHGTDAVRERYELTSDGCDVFNQLVAARRARVAEAFADLDPGRRGEVAALLGRLVRELIPNARPLLSTANGR